MVTIGANQNLEKIKEEVLAFAEAARAMATDRQLHLACGAAAREMAAAHFRESKMGDAYAQTANTARADFNGNYAVAAGVRVGFTF